MAEQKRANDDWVAVLSADCEKVGLPARIQFTGLDGDNRMSLLYADGSVVEAPGELVAKFYRRNNKLGRYLDNSMPEPNEEGNGYDLNLGPAAFLEYAESFGIERSVILRDYETLFHEPFKA
jgi:hypothetical protein